MPDKPVIIVTGASRGLGAAISCWLGKAGAAVTLIARSEEKLAQIATEVKRLGVVDTDMQAYIRDQGPKAMSTDQIAYYIDLKERGDLEPPEIPGRSIAWLALHAPLHFSGQFLDYDDPRIDQPALEFFGAE
jgi:NAD(P)-dependent dehydrogenase (short-subunit alcohol dehydrogenase family)